MPDGADGSAGGVELMSCPGLTCRLGSAVTPPHRMHPGVGKGAGQHSPTKSWLLSCRRTCPSSGAACVPGGSRSTCSQASFVFLSARTRCHRSSLRGAGACTVTSQGPFPTSKEKATSIGAGNTTHGMVGATSQMGPGDIGKQTRGQRHLVLGKIMIFKN